MTKIKTVNPQVQASDPRDNFQHWAQIAIRYCQESSLDKFLKFKKDFERKKLPELGTTMKGLINHPIENKWTCIHLVCKNGHSGLLQELISQGADYNAETLDDWTPLMLCSYHGYILCVQILLNQPNIQINQLTDRGTALHMSCVAGHTKLTKLLLDSQACTTIEDSKGKIPLEYATKTSIIELIPKYNGKNLLLKYSNSEFSNKPSSYSGELYWLAAWQLNDKLVLLFLDIETGHLLQYNKKINFMQRLPPDQQIPIVSIQDIRNVEESSVENKYFVHIHTENEIIKYYSKNIEVSAAWVKKLLDAVQYFKLNNESTFSSSIKETRLLPLTAFDEMEFEENDEEDSKEPVSFASFEILNEIGEGSFGKVFKVIKKNTGSRYALKAVSKLELKRNQQYKYIVAESRIQKSIDHPFIVKLYWAFQTPNNVYLVFEYCPYSDMSKLISKGKPLPEAIVKFYIAEILLAIEYLHSLDIVYRDLKPQNILIDEFYHAKLGDFGLARANTNKSNLATTFCGSPGYLAPEIIKDDGVWKPVDLYSLGICIYELLVGSLPFNENNVMKLYKLIVSGKIIFPNTLTPNARSLIAALTNKVPERRPSITEVKAHAFFEGINWNKLINKEVDPPLSVEALSEESHPAYFEDKDYSKVEDQVIRSVMN